MLEQYYRIRFPMAINQVSLRASDVLGFPGSLNLYAFCQCCELGCFLLQNIKDLHQLLTGGWCPGLCKRALICEWLPLLRQSLVTSSILFLCKTRILKYAEWMLDWSLLSKKFTYR